MGCDAIAEPVRQAGVTAHECARHAGLDRRADDRRGRLAHQFRRRQDPAELRKEPELLDRGVQGYAANFARLDSAAAAADPAVGRPLDRLGVAAGGLSAPGLRARYARHRSSRNQMQAAVRRESEMRIGKMMRTMSLRLAAPCAAVWLATATPGWAFVAYVSNEKGNTVTGIDTDSWTVAEASKVGQRPRGIEFSRDGKFVMVAVGDDDTIQVIDTAKQQVVDTLPSGPDPELFTQDAAGKTLYVANENDNTVTIIDLEKRAQIGDVQVGVEPEGMTVSPDGKILICTSETTNMAHFIDTSSRQIVANVLVDARPRFAEFKHDASELWVSSEIGGTVSIVDPGKHEVIGKVNFEIPGLRKEAIQPVGIGMTKDDKTAFVAHGPAKRDAIVDT